MPKNAIRTHADALKFMKYNVKTIHGISEDTYQGTPFKPLYGTGQGSGASSSVWLTHVVILLNTLDRIILEQTEFTSPTGNITSSRLVDTFVDNTSLGFTNNDSSYEEMIFCLQEISQTWEHLLHLSGGSLNLKKCNWYILFWDWKNSRPILREINPKGPQVELTQGIDSRNSTRLNAWTFPQQPGFSASIYPLEATSPNKSKSAKTRQMALRQILFHQPSQPPTLASSIRQYTHHAVPPCRTRSR